MSLKKENSFSFRTIWLKSLPTQFLKQYTSSVQKLLREELYLRRQKWTVNETLMFFKIQGIYKKYRNWCQINSERKMNNTNCIEKVSKRKLYLPKQKWTMNEHYFFKYKIYYNVLRLDLYLSEQKWTMIEKFSSKYDMYSKRIETKAVLTKTEMNHKQALLFFKILFKNSTYCSEFSLTQSKSEISLLIPCEDLLF